MSDEPRQAGAERGARRGAASEQGARTAAELVARLRHEINNPLTGLIGQAQLLLRDQSLSDEARRRVETIEQLAKRIRDTVAALRVEPGGEAGRAAEAGGGAAGGEAAGEEPPRH
jgi:nitrogen-specific signal transduction histidine kinase